jgi:flagellar transcriptional activator FlhD
MESHKEWDGTSNCAVAYLRLAKRLLSVSREGAMRQLEASAELADMLESFSLAQLRKLAATNFVLCAFRVAELPIAAFGAAREPAFSAQHTGKTRTPRQGQPWPRSEHPNHVWAGRLLGAFAAAGLTVQAAALAMTVAPSLAPQCRPIATGAGVAMALLAAGIVCCWWRTKVVPSSEVGTH